MTNLAVLPIEKEVEIPGNVISFDVLKTTINTPKKKPVSNKARKGTGGIKKAGVSSEVYAFRTNEEIKTMMDVFNKHIEEATDEHHKQIAYRNRLLFVIGLNVGIRASDLRLLQYKFFFDELPDGTYKWKESYSIQPVKTKKTKKFVKLFFNQAVHDIVDDYVERYPFDNLEDYLFASREGDEPIIASSLWRIIKVAAKEAGLHGNYGSHSLRKSFGVAVFNNAEDKNKALVVLQNIFGHSSTTVTMRYIGLIDDDMEEAFGAVNLGIDFI